MMRPSAEQLKYGKRVPSGLAPTKRRSTAPRGTSTYDGRKCSDSGRATMTCSESLENALATSAASTGPSP
eukprot:CAMPEP_0203827840 /NCGR_PEP_ID=MMETSP0115-20131106/59915_1 /ASSEMBLY_ACC=CAM_ASM_000227 /TAXON_ID=33651 /ORGANISM="Bicosoecid sp, Strain ms1" /LENGTH=69 /DNA_ID=CAMNT_0050736897 /DNA_START=25 /DNA_END=230 /DNA_ORIENTATION=-